VRSGYNEFLIEAAAHIKNEPFFKRQIYPKGCATATISFFDFEAMKK
jgi:hypothetical protein